MEAMEETQTNDENIRNSKQPTITGDINAEVDIKVVYQNVYRDLYFSRGKEETYSAYHPNPNDARRGLGKKISNKYLRTDKILLDNNNEIISRKTYTIFKNNMNKPSK